MTRCLLVGRFQPFHRGHLAVVRQIRAEHPRMSILLGIGSAQESYTLLNPFTAGERFEMIVRTAASENLSGIVPVPIPDIQRHSVWVAHVRSLLPPFEIVYTNNPLTRLLFGEAGYEVVTPALVDRKLYEGVQIRDAMAGERDWKELVPPAVAEYIAEIHGTDRLHLLSATGPDVAPEHPP
jgi:nicotinamide-nucleotide adenylyltransferase